MERWLPFDAQSFFDDLSLDSASERYRFSLYLNTGGTATDVARRCGLSGQSLADTLIAQRGHNFTPALRRTLIKRTLVLISQPHLLQHLLFHAFHDWAETSQTRAIYGLSPDRVNFLLYTEGETRVEVAAAQGFGEMTLEARIMRIEWKTAQWGVKLGAMSQRQATFRQDQLRAHLLAFIGASSPMLSM
jgi:hypothetical protein